MPALNLKWRKPRLCLVGCTTLHPLFARSTNFAFLLVNQVLVFQTHTYLLAFFGSFKPSLCALHKFYFSPCKPGNSVPDFFVFFSPCKPSNSVSDSYLLTCLLGSSKPLFARFTNLFQLTPVLFFPPGKRCLKQEELEKLRDKLTHS